MSDFDLIVVGSGSTGYHAARVASASGKRIALVEGGEDFGGLCILRGCMPTKAMLRTAEVMELIRGAGELAIGVSEPKVDWSGVVDRTGRLVREFAGDRLDAAEALPDVEIIRERASFDSPSTLRVGDTRLSADKFVIATGSVVWKPMIPGLHEIGFLTSDDVQTMEELPDSLIVFGGGAVAVEFSQLFRRLDVQVTVIQRSPYILSKMDLDVSVEAQKVLEDEGVEFVTSADVALFETHEGLKSCVVRTPAGTRRLVAEEILCAVGRRPAVEGLNCEAAGVLCEDGWVVVDENLRTSNPAIFAGGDVVGGPAVGTRQLVHVAVQHGEIIGRNVFGDELDRFDNGLVPEAVFTDPAIGAVGLTEAEAHAEGRRICTATKRFDDQGKAILMDQTKGFVKMIADGDSGEILGVHIIGPEGADLIHEAVVAMYYGATISEFVAIPHLHPTLAEALLDPAEEILDQMKKLSISGRTARSATAGGPPLAAVDRPIPRG